MDQNEQFLLKIDFENQISGYIRRLFNRIVQEFKVSTAAGYPIRASKYKAQWQSTIIAHYMRVQKAFRNVAKHNTKQENEEDKIPEELILAALLLWADDTSPKAAGRIIDTTQANMDAAMEQARQALSDEGKTDYTKRELAAVASIILKRKFEGRVSTIAITETQAPAEVTKLIDAYAMGGISPRAVITGERTGKTTIKKQWITMGDDRVRPAHRAANGQIKFINDPFIVMGQRLMYPGDASMGASAANIVNCRCSSLISPS